MKRHHLPKRSAELDFARRRRGCHRRSGYTLTLFVMMFFGLMALAALVIDMGFVRLAQRQMQTAVDGAALEGLCNGATTVVGRQQASQIVADMFTDYLDSNGETVHYGAGPVVTFSGGVGPPELAASQFMQPGATPVYQPITSAGTAGLELNLSNATEGDMVAGTYNPNQPSAEGDDYTRLDFTPASSSSSTASAFLVRMRRTGSSSNTSALDQEPGVSSSGPPLPILFGRGSLMARSGSTGQLSVASGVTVRATAIAGPQPAKTVGPAYTIASGTLTPQLAPFAIRSDLWASLTTAGTAASITVNPLAAGSGAMILASQFQVTLTAIGQPLVASTVDSALLNGPQSSAAYVPIYADFPSQAATIIGFVDYNNWTYQSGSLTLGAAATAVQIGGQNVSPTMALPLPAAIAPADVSAMLQDHAALFSQYPLYAPALLDRYIGPNP
jgi:hypothetical protein